MKIHYQLNSDDFAKLRQHLQGRIKAQASRSKLNILQWLLVGGGVGWLFSAAHSAYENPFNQALWLVIAIAYLGSTIWVALWSRSNKVSQWVEQFCGEYELILTSAGISLRAPGDLVSFRAWPEIVAFEALEDHLFIYLRLDVAFMIPCAGLDSEAFSVEFRRLWSAHPDNAGRSLPTLPFPARPFPLDDIKANLREAARVVFFRRFDLHAFRVSYGQLLWLLMLGVLLLGAADYVEALPKPGFNLYGFGMYGLSFILTMFAAMLISSALVSRSSMSRLLVMILASGLIVDLFYLPVFLAANLVNLSNGMWLWGIYLVASLWMLAAVFRIVRQLYRQPVPSTVYLVTLFAFITMVVDGMLPSHRMYYSQDPDDDASSYSRASKLDVEDVFYRQPRLVEEVLADLRPQRRGRADLYYVGFAGQAEEKVFANEVHYAQELLDRRFGTNGRSIALVNGVDTVATTPLANVHNLEAVLQGVARRMNRDEDVLFLYLSSHGAKDRSLSVSFWPLEFNDLKAEQLKTMLDKSGIRNRVIAVSACYSGGFLDVLRDDNTLVMTASSRDHVSYGCGDATQYTYFGEAYFVKSLVHRDSFISAFEDARRLIEEREKGEGRGNSGPQIYIGKNIEQKLHMLEVKPEEKLSQLTRLNPPFGVHRLSDPH